jgi:epoxyqueuosine reductase
MDVINEKQQLKIKDTLLKAGASKIGFANLSALPNVSTKFPSAISILVKLDPIIIEGIKNTPTTEYCTEYDRINVLLDSLVNIADNLLKEFGFLTLTPKATVKASELDIFKALIPHKTAARLSGLGWIGKNALLITEEYGSAVRLASVFTNADFKYDSPLDKVKCGNCMNCKKVCPGNAVKGINWTLDAKQKGYYDRTRCREVVENFMNKGVVSKAICGICIANCPFTEKYIRNSLKA